MVCDGLRLPYRTGCFDAVLSIGVIHHFSTKERRIRAIQEMTRILNVGGQIMIYVWAMEQKKRKFKKQDILVPWNLEPISHTIFSRKQCVTSNERISKNSGCFVMGKDLQHRAKSASFSNENAYENSPRLKLLSRSLDSGLDVNTANNKREQPQSFLSQIRDLLPVSVQNLEKNARKIKESLLFSLHNMSSKNSLITEHATSTEVIKDYSKVALPDMVSSCTEQSENNGHPQTEIDRNHQCCVSSSAQGECFRYYHIFKNGELNELIEEFIPELHIVQTYFDHANWCIVAEKIQFWKI
ncbi:hypothetical protein GDO86_004566 [Hymenochirus boettgeri]|uniref:Methyltransferase type 11 domain-containing protein n=1 Tax=Hymenochirus boettgeri TaxID=247094 RepID=A0A8T2KAD1_9PIPI|nr:hypothetical protein GDO86_004566 [Hymenochirus boettgeri]